MKIILNLLITIVAGYVLLCVLFYLLQNKIIFIQKKLTSNRIKYINRTFKNIKDIEIKIENGINLKGWIVNPDKIKDKPIIYFGGNGEEMSYLVEQVYSYNDLSFILINYRGFGLSSGKPTLKNIRDDSLKIYDYLKQNFKINPDNFTVIGRSLGTGVALKLATKKNIKKIILISPYDSISETAKYHYPYLPVSLILKYDIDSIKFIKKINKNCLLNVFAAKNDKIVPLKRTYNLLKYCELNPDNLKLTILENDTHNSISLSSTLNALYLSPKNGLNKAKSI